jgi:hypothetical protein
VAVKTDLGRRRGWDAHGVRGVAKLRRVIRRSAMDHLQ